MDFKERLDQLAASEAMEKVELEKELRDKEAVARDRLYNLVSGVLDPEEARLDKIISTDFVQPLLKHEDRLRCMDILSRLAVDLDLHIDMGGSAIAAPNRSITIAIPGIGSDLSYPISSYDSKMSLVKLLNDFENSPEFVPSRISDFFSRRFIVGKPTTEGVLSRNPIVRSFRMASIDSMSAAVTCSLIWGQGTVTRDRSEYGFYHVPVHKQIDIIINKNSAYSSTDYDLLIMCNDTYGKSLTKRAFRWSDIHTEKLEAQVARLYLEQFGPIIY